MSLAIGSDFNEQTFADFVARLRHDCKGAGVDDHCTKDALFIVERRTYIYGLDNDYADKTAIICDESVWHSIEEFINQCDAEKLSALDKLALEGFYSEEFAELYECQQFDIVADLPDHRTTGFYEQWDYVNSHFTKDAAEAFIKRKKHDYPDGIRVNVDAQIYCWEFNAIKEALMNGTLVFKASEPS